MKILVLGPQGSGKSTQAELLAEKLNWPHIEMGELLREAAKKDDKDAQTIRSAVEGGVLAPFEVTVRILKDRLLEKDCSQSYILDGFPRNMGQVKLFDPHLDKVFYLTLPDDVAVARLTKRGREDDNPEVIKQRLEIFHKETEPVLTYFRQKGILEEVDGTPDIKTIFTDLVKRIDKING
jgi:adenylate kinase